MDSPINKYLPVSAILLCCVIWGTTFVVVKDVSTRIDPFLLAASRNLLALVALGIYLVAAKKSAVLKIEKAAKYGAILGVLLGAIYILQTAGLVYTSSNHSAFISCSAVIMVPTMMYFIGWQKFTPQQVIAVVVVSAGLLLLTYQPGIGNFNFGDFLTFIAAVICAVHLMLSGHFVRKIDFLALIFYQFLFAALASGIGLLLKFSIVSNEAILFKTEAIPNVLYLGLLGTLFCYFVTVWGQKHVSTVYTVLIFSLEPIFASFTAYLVFGELFSKNEAFGALLIFCGILVYSVPKGFLKFRLKFKN